MEPMPLSRLDVVTDSDGNEIRLAEGMPVHLYDPDTDWYDRPDNLLCDGIATWRDDAFGHGPMWCVLVDERWVYHESDDPSFVFPELSPAEMREKMYRNIEQTVGLVPDPDGQGVKPVVRRCLSELRRIDAEELASGKESTS